MTRRKFQEIPGLRFKVRTDDEWIVVSANVEGQDPIEMARLHLALPDRPGDPLYHAWLLATENLCAAHLSREMGIKGIVMRRRKARD